MTASLGSGPNFVIGSAKAAIRRRPILKPCKGAKGSQARISRDGQNRVPAILSPLVVPVTLTFLVIPPEQGKDLDNIALTAIPIAHEVLRPHIQPHLLAPALRELGPDPDRDKRLMQLKSVNARSVRAYQVIELPGTRHDPPKGILRFALGSHARMS
jgi:hypothetical protein